MRCKKTSVHDPVVVFSTPCLEKLGLARAQVKFSVSPLAVSVGLCVLACFLRARAKTPIVVLLFSTCSLLTPHGIDSEEDLMIFAHCAIVLA